MKSGFEKGFATRARIILHEQEKLKKENSKPTPVIGPRGKLMHYIYDLNLDLENAMKEILKEFPALDEKLIKQSRGLHLLCSGIISIKPGLITFLPRAKHTKVPGIMEIYPGLIYSEMPT